MRLVPIVILVAVLVPPTAAGNASSTTRVASTVPHAPATHRRDVERLLDQWVGPPVRDQAAR
jgi:hypothetical protein